MKNKKNKNKLHGQKLKKNVKTKSKYNYISDLKFISNYFF